MTVAAFLAQTVQYGTERIEFEAVTAGQMGFDAFEFVTVHMDQFAAFLTFAVKTEITLSVVMLIHIFKACGSI